MKVKHYFLAIGMMASLTGLCQIEETCNYEGAESYEPPVINYSLMAGPCVSHNGFFHTPIGSLRIVVDALLNYCKFIDFNTKMFKL